MSLASWAGIHIPRGGAGNPDPGTVTDTHMEGMTIWRFLSYASLPLEMGSAPVAGTLRKYRVRPVLSMDWGAWSLLAHSDASRVCEIHILNLFLCLNKGSVTLEGCPFSRILRKVIERVHLPCLRAPYWPCDGHRQWRKGHGVPLGDPLRWTQNGGGCISATGPRHN